MGILTQAFCIEGRRDVQLSRKCNLNSHWSNGKCLAMFEALTKETIFRRNGPLDVSKRQVHGMRVCHIIKQDNKSSDSVFCFGKKVTGTCFEFYVVNFNQIC